MISESERAPSPRREPDSSAISLDDVSSLQQLERSGTLSIDAPAFVGTVADLHGLIALHEIGRGIESMALGLLNRPNVQGAAATAIEALDDLAARVANAAADKIAAFDHEHFDELDDGDISDIAPIVLPRAMSRAGDGREGPASLDLASRLAARFAEIITACPVSPAKGGADVAAS